MKSGINDMIKFLASVFFPNRCIFCDELIDPFEDYCDACTQSIPFIKGEICKYCGAAKDDCGCKKRHSHYYELIASPLYYEADVKSCIHRFKFRGDRNLSKPLGKLMAGAVDERFGDIEFDYVTYIPMFRKKEHKRGFNQSRLLAREVAELCKIPFADKMLIKLYDTDNQHDCSRLERTGNLIGAFDVNKSFDITNKTVLLIDDIKTSGATLNECGKMLYLNGANRVICLTAALRNSKIKKKEVQK